LGRSEKKSVDSAGMVWTGWSASEEIVAMRPRREGEETSSLKADWSSFETLMPDCMVGSYDLAG